MFDILLQVSLVIISLAFVVLCSWRRKRGYTSIPDEENVSEKLTRDKEFQRKALKETLCQFFLNLSGKYTFVEQLDDIGCRLGRSWFIVKESKSDKKLLVLTKKSSDCLLSLTPTTIQLLRDLFEPLGKHPYIFPVSDIDVLAQKPFVFVVESFQKKGTLKDLIYKTRPKEEWSGKYRVQGKGLNVFEIKTYGRQILLAMLFLHDKGIPTNGHVHSGNIFVKKGVCRISGYEQAILGMKSRLHPRLSKLLKKNKHGIDTLCFGHLLYEMSYGQELFDAKPGKLHFEFGARSVEVGEILKFVFGTDDSPCPDLQDILYHRFFQGSEGFYQIDPDSIYFKPQVTRCVLKPLRKYFRKIRRKSRKDQEEVGEEPEESPGIPKRSHVDFKQNGDVDLFTVSYNAETDDVSVPIPNKPLASSTNQPSTSPLYSSGHAQKPEPPAETRDEPQRPAFGVEALMNSIKQAIKLRHDTLGDSDSQSSRASSFSSNSPPPSPTMPAKSTSTNPPLSQTQPLPQKQSLSEKPSVSPKPLLSQKPTLSNKPSLSKKPSISKKPSASPSVPRGPPPPPAIPAKPSSDVKFEPQQSDSKRSVFLKSIENGTKLRKTVTNDRSAPRV